VIGSSAAITSRHDGESLFRLACAHDLEGIVAKRKFDPYLEGPASWLKIRNREYSQWAGRDELFERERGGRPGFPSLGWLRSGVQQRRDVSAESQGTLPFQNSFTKRETVRGQRSSLT
jgi:hypothetical protein